MAVDPAAVASIRDLAAKLPDAGEFEHLTSLAERIAYLVAATRADGGDELEAIELVLTVIKPGKKSLREAERVLRALGYAEVANLLQRLIHELREGQIA
jgi:ABC-type cobalamin/Fe3+-siderophores transport system ATPase subunit